MIETNRPLVYFENGADYNTQYTANNPNKDIQAVFVGDTKKIYTHGVEFDCNNTVYDDTAVRGLISDHDDDIQGILDNIDTLNGLIEDVNSDLGEIHNWSENEIKTSISNMLNDAQWLQSWASANNIAIGEPFTVGALEDGLLQYGLITKDGNTVTVGWAALQTAYNQLSASVQQLQQGGVDTEALKAELKLYIDNDTAIAQLTTYYATVDSQGQDIEWMLSGMKALASQNETFVDLWSAATQRISGLESDVQGIAGLTTRVSTLENAGFVAEADLATKVSAAGFATTAGTVAKSDLDGSVAALFSSTSSTKTALDNKGYLTSSDLDGYATENYVNTAGFLTQTDLNLATATMVASSELNGKIEDYLTSSQNTSGKWAAGVNASVSTANTNASNAVSTANSANNAVSTLFATNGAGTAAITSYVNNWWSGVTISADKVNLTGKYLNALFGETNQDTNGGGLLSIQNDALIINKGNYHNGILYTRMYPGQIDVYTEQDPQTGGSVAEGVITLPTQIKYWAEGTGDLLYLEQDGLVFRASSSGNDNIFYRYGADGFYITSLLSGTNVNNISTYSEYGTRYSDVYITGTESKLKNLITNQISVGDTTISSTGGAIQLPASIYTGFSRLDGEMLTFTNNGEYSIYIDGETSTIQAENIDQTSDRNLKDIVSDTTLTVEQVANAPAVDFTWKRDADKADKKHNVGTIAQYWQVVLPEVVGQSKDGALTMQYSNAAMVSSIVTAKEVVALKEEIEELKRQIAELKAN